MLTKKQRLYCDILEMVLPFMRNLQRQSTWNRLMAGAFYPEMELVHNLHRMLIQPEFTESDIHWLNYQARIFAERGNNKKHGLYEPIMIKIKELFACVPEVLLGDLTWAGPVNHIKEK